jgi:Rod binding domain-containing protein
MNTLSPDTTLALMQSNQIDASKAAGKAKSLKGSINLEKAEAAAQEFEAVFIAEMMKPMFEGISTDGMFGGGKGEEIFRGILLQEYGNMLSQTGSIGLASQVKDTMIQMQAEANGDDILSSHPSEDNTTETIALTNGDNDATSFE